MINLPTEILLYSNPFNLLFCIVGNESDKNCYISIFKKSPKDRLEVFFQGEPFPTKKEVIDNLKRILWVAIYNCQKVERVVYNLSEHPKGRRLTLEMVEEIIETFNTKDVWGVDTSEKKWKMKFLTKADGLVEGQKVLLTFLSGENSGENVERKLDFDVKPGFSLHFEGQLRDGNAVQKVEKKPDGSFLIETQQFKCSMVIIEK